MKLNAKRQWQVKQVDRDWLELPYDVMANILFRVGVYDILENAQKVCTTWYNICKDPAMWRIINMDKMLDDRIGMHDRTRRLRPMLREMCKHAVDRSQGQLVDITIWDLANKELLKYIADRSSQLRRLEVAYCTTEYYENWAKSLKKFPVLEELGICVTQFSDELIETASRCCPMLTTLKINTVWCKCCDDIAIVIGKNLPELKHLEVIGDQISERGFQAILDGCRHLELLDLRRCYLLIPEGEFWKNCLEKIKCVKLPNGCLDGCPYLVGDENSKRGLQPHLDGRQLLELLDLRQCLANNAINLNGQSGKIRLENIKCVKLSCESFEGFPYIDEDDPLPESFEGFPYIDEDDPLPGSSFDWIKQMSI